MTAVQRATWVVAWVGATGGGEGDTQSAALRSRHAFECGLLGVWSYL